MERRTRDRVVVQTSDARGYLDVRSALRVAREAIAAEDPAALEAAVTSVDPAARSEFVDEVRASLLDTGRPPDDPLEAVLDEAVVEPLGS